MSYKATAWAYDLPLKGPAKIVLVALADFADEAGSCYPGQERLALMTGLSRATIQRALQRLEGMGLMTREHRYDRRGYRTSDRYVLTLDAQVLGLTAPSGQSAYKAESTRLGLTVSTPKPHSEAVTIRRTTSKNNQGGANAPTPTPEPVDNPAPTVTQKLGDGELVPWCSTHPENSAPGACAACKRARLLWERSLIAGSRSEIWQPTRKPVKHIPGLCDAHRQPEATCEMCQREARQILTEQFGERA